MEAGVINSSSNVNILHSFSSFSIIAPKLNNDVSRSFTSHVNKQKLLHATRHPSVDLLHMLVDSTVTHGYAGKLDVWVIS